MNCAMKKFITGSAVALLAVLSSTVITGCGRSDREQVEQPAAAPATPSVAASDTAASTEVPAPGSNLDIPSIPNFRDLGGYATTGGSFVARGLVYRANQLSGISERDMQRLADIGLRTDYDLRTAEEKEKRPDELPAGVEYVWLNVLADSPQAGPAQLEALMTNPEVANRELGGGKVEAKFAASYREFVTLPSAQKEFGRLYLGLLDRDRVPAVFHCTTGKDRTGWAAAALLTLLGVPKSEVYADYLRSNDYILPAYQQAIDGFVAAGGEPEIPRAILGVKPEYLDAAFAAMVSRYGSIENYFSEALGIDAAQQTALRQIYVGPSMSKAATN